MPVLDEPSVSGGRKPNKAKKRPKKRPKTVRVLHAHMSEKQDALLVKKKGKQAPNARDHGALLIGEYHKLMKQLDQLKKQPPSASVDKERAAVEKEMEACARSRHDKARS